MTSELIHDRGRGPEIRGTRITVYNLLSHFLDPTLTEACICSIYELTPEQVAAARAYVLNNPDTVLAEHLRIEERLAVRTIPLDAEQARRERDTFLSFKEWLSQREEFGTRDPALDAHSEGSNGGIRRFPTFREWLRDQAHTTERT